MNSVHKGPGLDEITQDTRQCLQGRSCLQQETHTVSTRTQTHTQGSQAGDQAEDMCGPGQGGRGWRGSVPRLRGDVDCVFLKTSGSPPGLTRSATPPSCTSPLPSQDTPRPCPWDSHRRHE